MGQQGFDVSQTSEAEGSGSQEEHGGSRKCLGLANLSNDLKTKVGWCHLCSGPGFLEQEPKDLSNQPQAFF